MKMAKEIASIYGAELWWDKYLQLWTLTLKDGGGYNAEYYTASGLREMEEVRWSYLVSAYVLEQLILI